MRRGLRTWVVGLRVCVVGLRAGVVGLRACVVGLRTCVVAYGRASWVYGCASRVYPACRRDQDGVWAESCTPDVPPSLLDYVLRQRDRHATGALDAAWELPPWKASS